MEEKFSVSLELMIEKFKAKAQQTQNIAKNVASKIKENMSASVGGGAFKETSAESELLLTKINDIKATLSMPNDGAFKFTKSEILEMRVELEKLERQYDKINGSSNMFSGSFKKIQDGMDKSMKSAKRFTLSLFGIQSAFRALSRASSAYLAQDQETSNKIQSAWIGLGSIFAPVLEMIANFVIKAVKYLDVFWAAFTGEGFLKKAMEKTAKGATKAVGALNKQLAGFDELTNIGDTSGGVGGLDTNMDWSSAFEGIELNDKLIKKMQELGTEFKRIWDTYIYPVISGFLEGILWIVENWDNGGKDIISGLMLIGLTIDILTGNWMGAFLKFVGFIFLNWSDLWDSILVVLKGVWDLITFLVETGVSLVVDKFEKIAATGIVVWETIKETFNGVKDFLVGVFTGAWDGVKTVTKNTWDFIVGLFSTGGEIFMGVVDGIGSIFKTIINALLDGINWVIRQPFNVINGLLNKIRNISILGVEPFLGLWSQNPLPVPQIPKLATGTNYIPDDTMAQIHEGEAVVPKKFNSDEYFSRLGGNNSEETNSLLKELIDRVEQIEINPYTTIKDVGVASTNYINGQKRIMGRGVI